MMTQQERPEQSAERTETSPTSDIDRAVEAIRAAAAVLTRSDVAEAITKVSDAVRALSVAQSTRLDTVSDAVKTVTIQDAVKAVAIQDARATTTEENDYGSYRK